MVYQIKASHIKAHDNGDVVVVGFADDTVEPSNFVILQRAHAFDDQDKKLNMGKIYIEVGDQSRSQYGGIEAICVSEGAIRISLEETTKSKLQVDGNLEINVDPSHANFAEAVSRLRWMAETDGIVFEG